ncbi:myo-inositol monophosphatase 1 [Gracilaria domingensis]|nr:myo-inositol monophosphatase 1 [Gracilaria domingensis]KAI0560686.1 myo-inositol monophosphatase 1 [Gracilaria domingensis]
MAQPSVENGNSLSDDAHTRHLLALRLAREAGDIIFSLRFGSSGEQNSFSLFTKSGESDLVTTADHASQEHIFSALSNAYPHHRLIGEETKESHAPLDEKPTWIVDAIDGTTNFVHGVPHFAVCIAHARDKIVELGVVYNPHTREMFHAVRGNGAFMNGKKLNCSKTINLKDALILSEWGYVRDEGAKSMLAPNERLLIAGVRGIRQLGSGALDICYVAMGMADGVYCGVEDQKRDRWHVWDYAAASVIAKEAGAIMSTVDGDEFDVDGDSMIGRAREGTGVDEAPAH